MSSEVVQQTGGERAAAGVVGAEGDHQAMRFLLLVFVVPIGIHRVVTAVDSRQ